MRSFNCRGMGSISQFWHLIFKCQKLTLFTGLEQLVNGSLNFIIAKYVKSTTRANMVKCASFSLHPINIKSSHTCQICHHKELSITDFNLRPHFEALMKHLPIAWTNIIFIIYYKNKII